MTHSITNSCGKVVFSARYVQSKSVLVCDWIGKIDDVITAQNCCLKMVQLANLHHVSLILNDNRHQFDRWPNMNVWLTDIWIPKLAEEGVRYFAHLLSKDQHTNIAAHAVFNQPRSGIEFMTFSSCDSAFIWLIDSALKSYQ